MVKARGVQVLAASSALWAPQAGCRGFRNCWLWPLTGSPVAGVLFRTGVHPEGEHCPGPKF